MSFYFVNMVLSAASSIYSAWRSAGDFKDDALYHPYRVMQVTFFKQIFSIKKYFFLVVF